MTVSVNLLPASYRERRDRARRAHLWALVVITALVAQAAGRFVLGARAESVRHLYGEAESVRQQAAARRKNTAVTLARQRFLERRVALVRGIRERLPWRRVLRELAEVVPEGVVLTKLATVPGAPSSAQPSPTAKARTLPPLGQRKREYPKEVEGLMLTGMAIDHHELAKLLGAGYASGLFSNMQLIHASSAASAGAPHIARAGPTGARPPALSPGVAPGGQAETASPVYGVTFEVLCTW